MFEDAEVADIQVSHEYYEAYVSAVVDDNYEKTKDLGELEVSNPQGREEGFLRDDNYMKSGIADVTACIDEVLLQ